MRWVGQVLDGVSGLFLLIMVLAIFLQVVARYVFNHALPWPEELGRFLFAWIVFLGMVSVMRMDEMLSLDILYQWIPPRTASGLRLGISLIVLGFVLVMLRGGYELMIRQAYQRSVGLEIPMGVVYLIFPLSTGLMSLVMVFKVIRYAKEFLAPKDI